MNTGNIRNLFQWRKIFIALGLGLAAMLAGMLVAKGGVILIVAPIILGAGLIVLFLNPKIGIWVMPIVAFFSPFDPIGIGFSPEKILMAVVLVFWLFQRKRHEIQRGRGFRGLVIALGVYVSINLVSLLVSSYPLSTGMSAVQSLVAKSLLVFLTVSLLGEMKDLKTSIASLGVLTLIAFGSMVVVAFLARDIVYFRVRTEDAILPGLFSMTVFANPNFASAYGVMFYPILFGMGMQKIPTWKKMIFFGLSILAAGGTALTFSRAGLIELAVVTIYLVFRFRIRLATVFFAGLVAASLLLIAYNIPYVRDSINNTILGRDTSANTRIYLLRASWESVQDHPITGSGPGTYSQQITSYFMSYMYLRNITSYGISAHNDWTNLLVETGFLGAIAFLFVVAFLVRAVFRAGNKIPRNTPLWFILSGCLGSILGMMIDSFFHEVLIYNMVWFILGLILVACKLADQQPESQVLER